MLLSASCYCTCQDDGVHLCRRRDVDESAVGDDVVEAVALDLHTEAVLLLPALHGAARSRSAAAPAMLLKWTHRNHNGQICSRFCASWLLTGVFATDTTLVIVCLSSWKAGGVGWYLDHSLQGAEREDVGCTPCTKGSC